jgi:hypothetical protein
MGTPLYHEPRDPDCPLQMPHLGGSWGRLEDVHPAGSPASKQPACGRPPCPPRSPPLLSCHLCRPRHCLTQPQPRTSNRPAWCGASPSGSPPGSSPNGPGHLVHPDASGHLWSPPDGVGKHLSRSSNQPMLKGCFGGNRGSTGSCSSSSIQGESGRHAGGHHYWVATDPAGSWPESRSIGQLQRFPLPDCPVLSFGLNPLHQVLLGGVILSG